jgi:hypothetical protein
MPRVLRPPAAPGRSGGTVSPSQTV